MAITDYLSLISILISILALVYTYKSNTKRFELADQYKKDLLNWYQDTIRILLNIRGRVASGRFDWSKNDLLFSLLSNLQGKR